MERDPPHQPRGQNGNNGRAAGATPMAVTFAVARFARAHVHATPFRQCTTRPFVGGAQCSRCSSSSP